MKKKDESQSDLEQCIKELLIQDKERWIKDIFSQRMPNPHGLVMLPDSVMNIDINVDKEAKKYVDIISNELQSLREQLAESDVLYKTRLIQLDQANANIDKLKRTLDEQYEEIKGLGNDLSDAEGEITALTEERAELLEKTELLKTKDYNNTLHVTLLQEEVNTLKEHCVNTSIYISVTEEAISKAVEILNRKKSKI